MHKQFGKRGKRPQLVRGAGHKRRDAFQLKGKATKRKREYALGGEGGGGWEKRGDEKKERAYFQWWKNNSGRGCTQAVAGKNKGNSLRSQPLAMEVGGWPTGARIAKGE